MYFKLLDDSVYTYDVNLNALSDESGQLFTFDKKDDEEELEELFNLRIVLGKKCNFKCVYCMQGDQRSHEISTPEMSVKELCEEILRVADGRKLGAISFWGGEPLVYFDKIKEFYEILNPYFYKTIGGNGNVCIVTNGSLLGDENIYKWFSDRMDDWFITLSYDGPGQKLRGVDVLDESTSSGRNIKKLISAKPDRFGFSVVMSNLNPFIDEFFDFTSKRLGIDCRSIEYEVDFTLVNDDPSFSTAISFQMLPEVIARNYKALVEKRIMPWNGLKSRVEGFIRHLNNTGLNELCHAATDNTMSLEMTGNVIACQNVDSETVDGFSDESYFLCNIKSLKPGGKSPIPEMRSMRRRWESICIGCPVRYFCHGGCPIINPGRINENCNYFKAKYIMDFLWLITVITDQPVKEIYQHDSLPNHEPFHYYL